MDTIQTKFEVGNCQIKMLRVTSHKVFGHIFNFINIPYKKAL